MKLKKFQVCTKVLIVITSVVMFILLVEDTKSLQPSILTNPVDVNVKATSQEKFRQDGKVHPKHLSPEILNKVETLLLFIGYARSGHTLIGSLLDAHPHAVIANEYNMLGRWQNWTARQRSARYLFNKLYENSYVQSTIGFRSANKSQGRSYVVPNQWQGKYKDVIKVIGDKKGGRTTRLLASNNNLLGNMSKTVNLPIKIIHVVRNPFDNIATMVLRKLKINRSREQLVKNPVNESGTLMKVAINYINRARENVRLIQSLGKNVITLHSENVIKKPKQALQRLCRFLELACTEDYFQDCIGIIYKKQSKSRLTMIWSEDVKEVVLKRIKRISFLKMYSFDT